MYYLLNFSHPLTEEQLTAVTNLVGYAPTLHHHPLQFDPAQPLAEQITTHLAQLPLTADEWQTTPLLINLPGFAGAAAVLLAQIHGRTGHFPAIIRLRAVPGLLVTSYELAELINLENLRDHARHTRLGS